MDTIIEDIQMENLHIRCLHTTNHQENENTKIAMKYHHIPNRWPNPEPLTPPNSGEDLKQQELSAAAGENATWFIYFGRLWCFALWFAVWWFLRKLNILLSDDPTIIFPGIH